MILKKTYCIRHALLIVFIGVLFLASSSYSITSYYVSISGRDVNDGKSEGAPWKTIAKVNTIAFSSGDTISFRSGEAFFGQIILYQSGITIQSYGSTVKPVITGAVHLTEWTKYNSSIYVAEAGAFVKNLFSNGVQMTVARTPNTGFLAVGKTNGSTTLSASGVNQAFGYWNGSELHIRTVPWQYETRTVSSYDGRELTLSQSPDYPIVPGWGFYLDNTLAALDTVGEWYCDPRTNNVYFFAPGGIDPSTLDVWGSVLDYGIVSAQSNTTIQNLAFHYQSSAAVRFVGCASNVSLLSNIIFGQWRNGVEFTGSHSRCTIDGNVFQNINGRGIDLNAPNYFTVSNNILKSIGLIPGYGISGVSGMIAILSMEGAHNTINGNIIDSIGCIGIRFDGSNNRIENNVLSNLMLRTSDGGAIYAQNYFGTTQGSTVCHNIIENVKGYSPGTASPYAGETNAFGIYFDDACHDMTAEGNTIIHTQNAGIYSHENGGTMVMRNNTLYECGKSDGVSGAYFLSQDASIHAGFVFNRNIIYPPPGKKPYIVLHQAISLPMGTVDSNYYFNPHHTKNLFLYYNASWRGVWYTFAGWKSYTGQDAHSIVIDRSNSLFAPDTLVMNKTGYKVTIALTPYSYRDIHGNSVSGSVSLPPYSSQILVGDVYRAQNGKKTPEKKNMGGNGKPKSRSIE